MDSLIHSRTAPLIGALNHDLEFGGGLCPIMRFMVRDTESGFVSAEDIYVITE